MRLFFQRESNKKSAKPIIVIRILMVVTMGIFFVLRIIDGWDFYFLRLILITAGLISIIDAVEGYFQKENKRVYLVDLGFAILWFILAFPFINFCSINGCFTSRRSKALFLIELKRQLMEEDILK